VAFAQSLPSCQAARTSGGSGQTGWLEAIRRIFRIWRSRIGERHALALLDHRDLRDLGWTHADVDRELAKPFWRG
jgi:uncharacterized protein YjiS (DUF1127 family)